MSFELSTPKPIPTLKPASAEELNIVVRAINTVATAISTFFMSVLLLLVVPEFF
jgi:hypothetical protein